MNPPNPQIIENWANNIKYDPSSIEFSCSYTCDYRNECINSSTSFETCIRNTQITDERKTLKAFKLLGDTNEKS